MPTPTATGQPRPGTTILGLGAMGSALAARLLDAGHRVTAWNRSPGRSTALAEHGAEIATTLTGAVTGQPLIVACLLRHASVHETLDPVVDQLRGRVLINLTTTTPSEARELATWATEHDIAYLDGAILAVPEMIGSPEAQIFYSGAHAVYEQHRSVLDAWGTSTYDGDDAGMASLIDLAMLAGMYHLFAGFFHGAAMVGSEGMTAAQLAERATPFLGAMTAGLGDYAEVIDVRDYTGPGQQSLEFSDLAHMVRASEEQHVNASTLAAIQALISEQIAAGHGSAGLARIYESLRADGPTVAGVA